MPVSDDLRAAWRFHQEWSGYSTPPGRAACALDLARAELALRALDDAGIVRVKWETDPAPYETDVYTDEEARAKFESGEWRGPFVCSIGTAGSEWAVSLGGIVLGAADPDPYERTVEAELASELVPDLLDDLRRALDRAGALA